MSTCPDESTLLAVAIGDSDAAALAHSAHCRHCAARLAQLKTDLGALRGVLVDAPLPPSVRRAARRTEWLSGLLTPLAAVGLATALALAVVWPRLAPHATPETQPQLASLTADVTAALFASREGVGLAEPLSDHAYVVAALNGGWPCDSRYGNACSYDDLLDQ